MTLRDTEEGEVAESKRRGEDAVVEHLDGVVDDAVGDDVLDGTDLDRTPAQGGRNGRARTKSRRAARAAGDGEKTAVSGGEKTAVGAVAEETAANEDAAARGRAAEDRAAEDRAARAGAGEEHPGIFGRFIRFIREVVAELRKVIWPTRKELLTYTTVVVVFVAIMLTIVGLLDSAFAWAVLHVFGGKK